ncbi:hypothetical protein PoB_000407900 [Plakobranchus ocellatus]|uniref:Uncharacterized protein n=1 Tax=Plakobranchus ocellatus TaxID=259542 RepID=A0AAV3Y661_9GAST|nr:hypothetical protein PoB_000407900 [Plakobranchus ocellatus]
MELDCRVPDLGMFIDRTIKQCLLKYDLDVSDTEAMLDDMVKASPGEGHSPAIESRRSERASTQQNPSRCSHSDTPPRLVVPSKELGVIDTDAAMDEHNSIVGESSRHMEWSTTVQEGRQDLPRASGSCAGLPNLRLRETLRQEEEVPRSRSCPTPERYCVSPGLRTAKLKSRLQLRYQEDENTRGGHTSVVSMDGNPTEFGTCPDRAGRIPIAKSTSLFTESDKPNRCGAHQYKMSPERSGNSRKRHHQEVHEHSNRFRVPEKTVRCESPLDLSNPSKLCDVETAPLSSNDSTHKQYPDLSLKTRSSVGLYIPAMDGDAIQPSSRTTANNLEEPAAPGHASKFIGNPQCHRPPHHSFPHSLVSKHSGHFPSEQRGRLLSPEERFNQRHGGFPCSRRPHTFATRRNGTFTKSPLCRIASIIAEELQKDDDDDNNSNESFTRLQNGIGGNTCTGRCANKHCTRNRATNISTLDQTQGFGTATASATATVDSVNVSSSNGEPKYTKPSASLHYQRMEDGLPRPRSSEVVRPLPMYRATPPPLLLVAGASEQYRGNPDRLYHFPHRTAQSHPPLYGPEFSAAPVPFPSHHARGGFPARPSSF